MAKKPKSTKKSRFGNPAKAAADAATRTQATPSADARLERAMIALSPGFVAWLESQGRPDKSIDMSLLILDDFFDMYRIVEPQVDPTALVPAAVQEVMDVTADANPLGVMGMRSGVRDYVNYLDQMRLWTGAPEDLAAVRDVCSQTGGPGTDFERSEVSPEDWEFADVFIPELSRAEIVETANNAPLWKNTLALLEWLGDGRELTGEGTMDPAPGALAALAHSGVGRLAAAANFTTSEDHDAARLDLYWELLNVAGLVSVEDNQLRPTPGARALGGDDDEMILAMRDLMGQFIYIMTLEGSEEGGYEEWHLDMADWLTQAASEAPPEAELLIQALAEPDTADPDVLAIAQNIAQWAQEGLVTVDEFVQVPPAWRPDVFDMLKDDFTINATGPGAAAAQQEMPDQA
ncbi:MAG: hypothetical protein ABI563_02250 [Specibacter sp.]